ncbi:ribbon-helix-helix domain-containing protein [Melaminivora sp.]
MHFNLYLDDQTGNQLAALTRETGETRNALIRQAVSDWLARHSKPQWPAAVLDFAGVADMPPFESHRDALTAPAEDPLA